MIAHKEHQMQLTSLYQYFPSFDEQEVNQAFRQETKQQIIILLQSHQNLTDREISSILGYADPNKVRPRRNELVAKHIVEEDCKRICSAGHKLSIAWRLNKERLFAYMRR